MFHSTAFAPPTCAAVGFVKSPPQVGERYEFCSLVVGGQAAGDALYKANPSSVTINQRPLNGGRWGLSGRPITEKYHVGVFTDGENIRSTSYQDIANLAGNNCAVGIATHLAMAGQGPGSGPFIVHLFGSKKHNRLLVTDKHHQEAAAPLLLRTGQRQRWAPQPTNFTIPLDRTHDGCIFHQVSHSSLSLQVDA